MTGITVDPAPAIAMLRRFRSDQLPYATARSLTMVSRFAQERIREELPNKFIVRRDWVARGILSQRAEKRDWPSPFAVVYSRDRFMALQETGGVKTSESHGLESVPSGPVEATWLLRVVPRSLWPAALLSVAPKSGDTHSDGFFVDLTRMVVFQRLPDERLQSMWQLRSSVNIKATWGFRESVARTVKETWPRQFAISMNEAIKTARPKD